MTTTPHMPPTILANKMIVSLETDEDGSFLVSDDLLLVWGQGESPMQALRDYAVSLTEYCDIVAGRKTGSFFDDPE